MNRDSTDRDASESCVLLVGYRASGKTTVGRLLAARLGWRFVDLDEEIERRSGLSDLDIFLQFGEKAFRQLESEALDDLLPRPSANADPLVLSAGGGAVVDAANRAAIRSRARCVWLCATEGELHRRIVEDADRGAVRPALTTLDSRAEIERLLRERTPHYEAVAQYRVDTDRREPAEIAETIAALLATPPTEVHWRREP